MSGADQVRMIQVRPVLHIGKVDPFVFPEVPQVRAGMAPLMSGLLVQLPAPVVNGIGVVIGNSLTTQSYNAH